MAARFWVGGTGNWDASDTTHWSATSGGAGGASVPGASDDVTMDASSGGGTVTATAAINVISITGGAFTGTFNTNGQTLTVQTFDFSGTGNRTLTLGSSSITCTKNNVTVWNLGTATNLTFNANTSTITMSGNNQFFIGGGKTYNTVVFQGGTLGINGITDINTFANLTMVGSANKTDQATFQNNQTVTGVLTLTGNSSTNRLLVRSIAGGAASPGTTRTITNTGATVTISNCDFMDIAFTTTWDASARTDIGDCGGNSGITFPASVAQYYGGVNINGSYLRSNGITSNYVSTPHSTPLELTGDITVDAKIAFDDWTPAAAQCIVAKWIASGNHRNFEFYLNTDGYLFLGYSVDGSASVFKSSGTATGVTDGATKWVRFTQDVDDGAGNNLVKFYLSDDGVSWVQLGSTSTTAGAITRYNATSAKLEIGSTGNGASIGAAAKVYQVRVYSDITQTTKAFDSDFAAQAAGTKSFTESSTNAATVSLAVTGGNWSASSWTTRVPLPQDDCYLGNAFTASQTVTADMPRLGRSIDWTGATGTPTFAVTSTTNSIFGSLTLISAMSVSHTQTTTFAGRSSYTLTSSSKDFAGSITLNAPSGTISLQDALTITGSFNFINGTFTTNNNSVTCNTCNNAAAGTRTWNLGTSTWTLTRTTTGTVWEPVASSNFNGSSSTIVLAISSNARTFSGSGMTYGNLTYTAAGSTGKLTITGSNSFSTINFSDASNARTLEFTAGTTTTIRDKFNVNGLASKLMTITSATAATHTLSMASGIVNCDYLNLSYSIAQGGAKWYAGNDSTDSGNNSGWIFTSAPVFSSGNAISSKGLINLQNIQNL